MFRKGFFVAVCFVALCPCRANTQSILEQMEGAMLHTIDSLIAAQGATEKNRLNDRLLSQFDLALKQPGAFSYPFSSLKNIGFLTSPDGRVRFISWNVPQGPGRQNYYGYALVVDSKGATTHYRLIDSRHSMENPQMDVVGPEGWYGALYYNIRQEVAGSRTLYTLFGVDMFSLFTTRRVIEVFWIDDQGYPRFGAPVFKVKNSSLCRVIFEYSATVSMSLSYDSDTKMIVFDHLSPQRPDMVGNYQFYGPDFSFDGFRFADGVWQYVADINVRNKDKTSPKTPVSAPEKNPEPGFLYQPNVIGPEKTRKP